MPLPPPPEAALSSMGAPSRESKNDLASAKETGSEIPGTTGIALLSASARA